MIKIPITSTRSHLGLRLGNVAKQKYKDLSHRYQWRSSNGTADTEEGMVVAVFLANECFRVELWWEVKILQREDCEI